MMGSLERLRFVGRAALVGLTIVISAAPLPARAQTPAPTPAAAASAKPTFRIFPPGHLKDNYGHATRDYSLYAPGMRFPVDAPTTLNSQLRNPGGGLYRGPAVAGGQCADVNHNEEWWDTFCETRDGTDRNSLNCTSRQIHQGVDIRGGTSETCRELVRTGGRAKTVRLLAVLDGEIYYASGYTVKLRTAQGDFWYLHMNMNALEFDTDALPVKVKAGQHIGYLSNDFGGSATTFHLHLEHRMAIAGKGIVPVPMFCDLALAYERDRGKTQIVADGSQRCDGSTAAPAAVAAITPQTPAPLSAAQQPGAAATTVGGAGTASQHSPLGETGKTVSFWRHGGSEMRLVADGTRRAFVYDSPNEGIRGQVSPGTWLFQGEKVGESAYKGKARVFNAGCPPSEYDVEGPIEAGGKRVLLMGMRPVSAPGTCDRVQLKPDRLVFVFSREASVTPATSAVAAAPAIAAVPGAAASPPTLSTLPAPTTSPSAAPAQPSVAQPAPASPTLPATATVAAPTAMTTAGHGFQQPRCSRDRCVDRGPFLQAFNTFHKSEGSRRRDLNPWQNDALTALLNVWDTTPDLENDKRLAYILATVYHETSNTIYPTRECSCRTNAGAIACSKRLHSAGKASAYYLRDQETGHSYYGRGQTQLTLKDNYSKVEKFLGARHHLVWQPDDALSLEVSSKNAVLGLYNGWYRYEGSQPIALKNNAFASDEDWLRARDVLISKRRHAEWVAGFGRKIERFLRFIPRQDFIARYGAEPPLPTSGSAVPVAGGSSGTETVSPSVQASVVAMANIPGDKATAELLTLIEDMRKGLSELETAATETQLRGNFASRVATLQAQLTSLAAGIESETSKAATSAISGSNSAVDFQTTWPPDHREHAWCALHDDDKSVPTTLAEDDPIYLRYFKD